MKSRSAKPSQRLAAWFAHALVLVGVLAMVPMRVAGGEPSAEHVDATSLRRPGLMDVDADGLDARLRTIRERLELDAARLESLQADYRKASDPMAAARISAQIRELKLATEEAVLRIQLEYARSEGRIEDVATLEALLAQRAEEAIVDSAAKRLRSRPEVPR